MLNCILNITVLVSAPALLNQDVWRRKSAAIAMERKGRGKVALNVCDANLEGWQLTRC
jgi:hypothetical protein